MKNNLEARDMITPEISSMVSSSVQEDVQNVGAEKVFESIPGQVPNKLNDETYRQINSVSFRDDFQVLVKHYKF